MTVFRIRISAFTLKIEPWAPACSMDNTENGRRVFVVYQSTATDRKRFLRVPFDAEQMSDGAPRP